MNEPSRTITVAGGGIAGLSAALCLAQRGFRVDVFERAAAFESVGAGLQISPNAFHVIDGLGLGRALKAVATAPLAIRVMNARSGREIARIPLGEQAIERYGAPYLVAHRADLHQVLAVAAKDHPDIALRLGQRLDDVAIHANGVTSLVFGGGKVEEYQGLAMIAADGVWSRLRNLYFDKAQAVHSGLTAWRGLVPMEVLPAGQDRDNVQLWLAPNAHAVSYPIRQGRYLNFVAITATPAGDGEPAEGWAHEAKASELENGLAGWHRSILDLIAHRTHWTKWPLFAAPALKAWSHGAMVLTGDAAHAMLPFAAQGAAMAIEDAAVLAQCLAKPGATPPEEAFAQFEKLRRPRVKKAADLARTNQSIYHMRQPLAAARDASMAAMGGERLLARQDWLYGWKPA
ncbi:MAG: FAD-dependent monooxygenase [Nitratireductor sp.]|nr:FAD-dependent monooxygenase [Nitratireductor sp.]